MRQFFALSVVNAPARFLARVNFGAIWGVLLGDYSPDARVALLSVLCLFALVLSWAFVGWDVRSPLHGARLALYGTLVVGEALCVGAIVLLALAAFQGQMAWGYAAVVAAFSGYLAAVYAVLSLVHMYHQENSNTEGNRGSKD